MKLVLIRTNKADKYTEGNLECDGKFVCFTLEDKDRSLDSNMSEEEIKEKKVYGETAIPVGTYEVDMNTVSPKFKDRSWALPYEGKIPRLKNVKGFDGVLIHPFNSADESLGCIGPETSIKNGVGSNSITAFNKLMTLLTEAHSKNESIYIIIV